MRKNLEWLHHRFSRYPMQPSSPAAITGHRVTVSERMEISAGPHTAQDRELWRFHEQRWRWSSSNSKTIHSSELLMRFADATTELPHPHQRLAMTPCWSVSCKWRRTRVSVCSCMHDARTDASACSRNTSAFCSYKMLRITSSCFYQCRETHFPKTVICASTRHLNQSKFFRFSQRSNQYVWKDFWSDSAGAMSSAWTFSIRPVTNRISRYSRNLQRPFAKIQRFSFSFVKFCK